MRAAEKGRGRESMRIRREREHSLSFFVGADWEPARSRETMTTRQPTLATKPGVLTVRARRAAQQGLI